MFRIYKKLTESLYIGFLNLPYVWLTMKISVFGLGYVGSVTAACFAKLGHEVIGVDVIKERVDAINKGKSPIKEKGLDVVVKDSVKDKKLSATTSESLAVNNSDISFVCVGTPPKKDGTINLTYLNRACKNIGNALKDKNGSHIIVIRSTVIPGTYEQVLKVLEESSGKKEGKDFHLALNPEFLREGDAIKDFLEPSLVVIGAERDVAETIVELYKKVNGKVFVVKPSLAEMIKYVNNSFHALKVSFANEIGTVCKALDIDGKKLMGLFCEDKKLNLSSYYLMPGFAYGGSCLPKDLAAIVRKSKELELELPLLETISKSNHEHISRAIKLIKRLGEKKVGIIGLSFKKGTDDIRGNPLIPVINRLVKESYDVKVYSLLGEKEIKYIIKSYSKTVYDPISKKDLKLTANDIKKLFYPLDDVLKSKVILVASRGLEIKDILKRLNAEQVLVDLQGTINPNETKARYMSLC